MSPEDILKVARTLVDALLTLLPHDNAKLLLDEAAIARSNALADMAEDVKFGPQP